MLLWWIKRLPPLVGRMGRTMPAWTSARGALERLGPGSARGRKSLSSRFALPPTAARRRRSGPKMTAVADPDPPCRSETDHGSFPPDTLLRDPTPPGPAAAGTDSDGLMDHPNNRLTDHG